MVTQMVNLAQRAKEQLTEVTGFSPVAAVGGFKDDEGWHITVDAVEMARIPQSTDIIGTYVVSLDQEGNMVKFEKKRARLDQSYDALARKYGVALQ